MQPTPGARGVKQIVYSASGAQTISSTPDPGDSASVPITAEGETTIIYSATDHAGNTETSKTVTIMLDKSAPRAAGVAPTGPGVPRGTDTTARFSEKMDKDTLTRSTVQLVDTTTGKRVGARVRYD